MEELVSSSEQIRFTIAAVRSQYVDEFKELTQQYQYGRFADLFEAMVAYIKKNRPELELKHSITQQ